MIVERQVQITGVELHRRLRKQAAFPGFDPERLAADCRGQPYDQAYPTQQKPEVKTIHINKISAENETRHFEPKEVQMPVWSDQDL
jgi:hypothetical protein